MLENLFGADMPAAVRFGLVFLVVILFIGGLYGLARFFREPQPNKFIQLSPPVQIAHMVETIEGSGGVAAAAICLLIASAISFFVFMHSSTVLQEISALLMWSGNGIFWGVIMITAALGRKRTYVVYRDVAPAERQEPRFEKP
jgi:hypothetical protein